MEINQKEYSFTLLHWQIWLNQNIKALASYSLYEHYKPIINIVLHFWNIAKSVESKFKTFDNFYKKVDYFERHFFGDDYEWEKPF